jgi:hypothetical protein
MSDIVYSDFTPNLSCDFRYVQRKADRHSVSETRNEESSLILRCIVESALVTWMGLLLYGVGMVAPHGHVTVSL